MHEWKYQCTVLEMTIDQDKIILRIIEYFLYVFASSLLPAMTSMIIWRERQSIFMVLFLHFSDTGNVKQDQSQIQSSKN